MYKKIVLMMLEGFGVSNNEFGNLVNSASMPEYSKLLENNLSTILKTNTNSVPASSDSYYMIGSGNETKTALEYVNEVIEDRKFLFKSST